MVQAVLDGRNGRLDSVGTRKKLVKKDSRSVCYRSRLSEHLHKSPSRGGKLSLKKGQRKHKSWAE